MNNCSRMAGMIAVAFIFLMAVAVNGVLISPRTRDELEKIGASAKHLLALINDILDMSRIESGRMELNEKDFSRSAPAPCSSPWKKWSAATGAAGFALS